MADTMDEKAKATLEALSDEQKKKAEECRTPGELAAYLGGLGMELPDALLDEVSGGVMSEAYLKDKTITQADYDTWVKYCYLPPDEGVNAMGYWITWNIPRICDFKTPQERYNAFCILYLRKGYKWGDDLTTF